MVDPRKHADHRGWLESVLHHIPGFRGYLDKEYRRDSDHLARTHLADRLQAAKRGINQFQRSLLAAGRLDDLTQLEQAITSIDTLTNRLRGDVRGYSGFFDFVKVDEAMLDRIYEHDLQLITDVDSLVKQTEALSASRDDPGVVATQLQQQIDAIVEKYSLRSKILTGLETTP